jgi:hypothetical protein
MWLTCLYGYCNNLYTFTDVCIIFSHLCPFNTIDAKVGFCFICCIYTGRFVRTGNSCKVSEVRVFLLYFFSAFSHGYIIVTVVHFVFSISLRSVHSMRDTHFFWLHFTSICIQALPVSSSIVSITLFHYTFVVQSSTQVQYHRVAIQDKYYMNLLVTYHCLVLGLLIDGPLAVVCMFSVM